MGSTSTESYRTSIQSNSGGGWEPSHRVEILLKKYKLSDKKSESLNDVTMKWHGCKSEGVCNDLDNWFSELYRINQKFKKFNILYKKDDASMKVHVWLIYRKSTSLHIQIFTWILSFSTRTIRDVSKTTGIYRTRWKGDDQVQYHWNSQFQDNRNDRGY